MKINYVTPEAAKILDVNMLYKDVAVLLSQEPLTGKMVTVSEEENPNNKLVYNIGVRSGTRFITEVENTMPDRYLDHEIEPKFLTCVDPQKNAYKFYKLSIIDHNIVRASYGRMGQMKGQLFGERSFDYPLSMFWIKYFEKLSKGYIDRSTVYLSDEKSDSKKTPPKTNNKSNSEKKTNNLCSTHLFAKLKKFAKKAVEKAQVKVPISKAILEESHRLLAEMKKSKTVDDFNQNLLELISILQRPVKTGDGSGVKMLLAENTSDFHRIITREEDLIQAMEGSYYGSTNQVESENFDRYGIEIYEATEKQKAQVLSHLNDTLKRKVHKIYRVIPLEQQKAFNEYLKRNHIKKVKQLWHGSRNQNWMSIIINSLKLRPDAIITGKMFGDGIYFAPSSAKSWNYTSYRGTSWANGMDDIAFMGLYATAYGTPHDVDTWSSTTDYKHDMMEKKCNCVHAHAGSALKNDEIIYYSESAMVVNYIVEFK